jgi:hypothetical protein
MVDPPVAKFAPCLKFVPIEFRYALKYGNLRRLAAKKKIITDSLSFLEL